MKRETSKGKRQYSVKGKIIGILLSCWMLPFLFLIGILGMYLANNHSGMTAENFQKQLAFSSRICVERLNAAVNASRDASYDGQLLAAAMELAEGKAGILETGDIYKEYLANKYQKNKLVSEAFFWVTSGKDPQIYNIYNEKAGGSYQQVLTYMQKYHEDIKEYAGSLGTRAGFVNRDGRCYLVRNLVDSCYKEQAVLVLHLNEEYCFESLINYPACAGANLRVNGEKLSVKENEALDQWQEARGEKQDGYAWERDTLYIADRQQGSCYWLDTAVVLGDTVTKFPFYGYEYVMAAMIVSLVAMLVLMVWVFRKEVSEPVEHLSEGARNIEKGNLGYQLETFPANREFSYLTHSFNEMSEHLKQQFDKIYREEIALREARIMALQSNINPHFLNNTLEIINWEARFSGNTKVSDMIGALSTMLDAAMDRRKRPEVRLREEMGYVNSYLYITRERLGSRLHMEIDVPEELMDYLVPRLVLQPVVENAIEHGVVPNTSGTVTLVGRRDEKYLYLETINDGEFTEEDRKKVAWLLSPAFTPKERESSGNLGIANVNQRLRILYGEPCGLYMEELPDGKVLAKIVIPLRK